MVLCVELPVNSRQVSTGRVTSPRPKMVQSSSSVVGGKSNQVQMAVLNGVKVVNHARSLARWVLEFSEKTQSTS